MTLTLAVLVMMGQIVGKVVSVTDGDTLIVRESPTRSVTVRLIHIDAPERGQAFGTRARQTLDEWSYGKEAEVIGISRDRYGRLLGEVVVDGRSMNLELVRHGLAWSFTEYEPPEAYVTAEDEARKSRRGLWVDRDPIAPWDYRKRRRTTAAR